MGICLVQGGVATPAPVRIRMNISCREAPLKYPSGSVKSLASAELPVSAGTKPDMGSTIAAPLPAGVSREAIEQMLQDSHEQRMGEHL